MNTKEIPLGQILEKLKKEGILKTKAEVMVPLNGKHGDICVVAGFTTMVQERATNHDPQHVPYGIAWRRQEEHATEQLTTTPPPQTQIPTAPDTTTESSAAATEHSEEVLLLRCRRRSARSRNRRRAPRLSRKECSAGGMSAGPARPSLQRAGWLLQSAVLLLRSAVMQRSRSSAQRPRGPSLATKRRLLQSSAEEDARTIPQLRLHPRLGTKND